MSAAPLSANDPFACKRAAMREEFLARHFLLGGWIGGTDTYKRTMWAAVPDIALARAGYRLTLRKGLPEPGAEQPAHHGRPRGHARPVVPSARCSAADIELAGQWFAHHSATRAFPQALWDAILAQPARRRRLSARGRVGLPRRADVPGWRAVPRRSRAWAAPSRYLEPAMCRYFAPVIQATKARLMKPPRRATPSSGCAPPPTSSPISCSCWPATSAAGDN